jgi:RNA polymerase sigma-70 factor, ECF subfamily
MDSPMSIDAGTHEELSDAETTHVLGIKPSAAVNRSVGAIKWLKGVFEEMPGGIAEIWG